MTDPSLFGAEAIWPALDSLLAGLVAGPVLRGTARTRFVLLAGACDGLASLGGTLLPVHPGWSLPDWLGYLLAVPLASLALLGRPGLVFALPVLLAFDNLLHPATPAVAALEAACSAAMAWFGTAPGATWRRRVREV